MNDTDTLADDLRKDSLALMKLLADEKHKSEALAAGLAVEKMQHSVTIADEHESRSAFQHSIRALEAERDDVVEARGEMAKENVRLATEMAEWRELYEFGLNDRNELLARAQTAEAYAARNALRVIEVEAALRKHMDHHDGCESNDWSNESDWITTSFGFVLKSDECSCGANQLALELDPAAKAVVDGYASETKSAPGFCPECLMTGGHKLRCSKAETTAQFCVGCDSNWPVAQVGDVAYHFGPTDHRLRCTAKETACESRCAFDTNNGDRCILPDGHEGNHSL